MSKIEPVVIIGAGVSGLTLAQGLRHRSIPFRLFERRPNSSTAQGHRFRMSKDAIAAIKSVLSPELQALFDDTAAQTNKFKPRYVDAQEFHFDPPVEVEDAETKPIDRSWLRSLLMLGLRDSIEFDKDFESFKLIEDDHVEVHFRDGTSSQGSLLVGADGISSKVRKQLQPQRGLLDLERYIMWGRTPLSDELRGSLSTDTLSWYMVLDHTANVQMVVEPMIWSDKTRAASKARLPCFDDYIYWAICTASDNHDIPQTAAEREAFLKTVTETWHPELRRILRSAPPEFSSLVPVLSSRPDIGMGEMSALSGRVTLVGDCAHAMSPMGGSGATTAVESAADLAKTIHDHGISSTSIRAFECRMAERAKAKIEHSFQGGKKFWKGKAWHEYHAASI